MAKITVAPLLVTTYKGITAPAFARLFASASFTTSTSERVIGGTNGFYRQVPVTVGTDGAIIVSAFTGANNIDSTTDAHINTHASYSMKLVSAKGVELAAVFEKLRVPPGLPSTTWDVIEIYNKVPERNVNKRYPSIDEFLQLVAAIQLPPPVIIVSNEPGDLDGGVFGSAYDANAVDGGVFDSGTPGGIAIDGGVFDIPNSGGAIDGGSL